jgi:hypothetical protein
LLVFLSLSHLPVSLYLVVRRLKAHFQLDAPARPVKPAAIKRITQTFSAGVKLVVMKKIGSEIAAQLGTGNYAA